MNGVEYSLEGLNKKMNSTYVALKDPGELSSHASPAEIVYFYSVFRTKYSHEWLDCAVVRNKRGVTRQLTKLHGEE